MEEDHLNEKTQNLSKNENKKKEKLYTSFAQLLLGFFVDTYCYVEFFR